MPSAEELEGLRPQVMGHCYRMLGSFVEAEDATQEVMLRAWRGREGFDGRSLLSTWLYTVATRVCLDMKAAAKRRERPMESGEPGSTSSVLEAQPAEHWLEPISDQAVIPERLLPEQAAMLRQSIGLAFVSALQHLPAKQRAALLLADVLDFSAAEISATLEMSVAAVNSALQRARAGIAEARKERPALFELNPEQQSLAAEFARAFEAYDVEALGQLLHRDAVLSMPPYTLWLQGEDSIAGWLLGPGIGCRGSRLVPREANGLPAFGQYRFAEGKYTPWALIVLETAGSRVLGMNYYLDVATLFPRFGLPSTL